MIDLKQINSEVKNFDPSDIVRWAVERFGLSRIALASSFSIEDQVLTFFMASLNKNSRIFTLDTGRHFQETYDTMQKTMELYGIRYEIMVPDQKKLGEFVSCFGPNCFYESVEKRKNCCAIRKTEPLQRVLGTVDAWICGLRRDQSVTRTQIDTIEWDEQHSIYKINPLCNWSEEQVWDYINCNSIPYSTLYKKGFRSVGCQPCTRAVKEDEDIRAGRWWWEDPQHKECGLHRR